MPMGENSFHSSHSADHPDDHTHSTQHETADLDRFAEFKRGIRIALPIMIGYLPIAISYGVLAIQADIPLLHTVAMSMLVYAGASQFMAVSMIGMGIGALEIIVATFVLNFRHFIMSMSLMNRLPLVPRKWKALLSYGITDETFAVSTMYDDQQTRQQTGQQATQQARQQEQGLNAYLLLGLMLSAYLSWAGGSLLGGMLSMVIPPEIGTSMSIALYAMFIGLLIPSIQLSWKVGIIAAVSAGFSSLLYMMMSEGWAIVLATLLASVLGIWLTDDTQDEDQPGQKVDGENEEYGENEEENRQRKEVT